ncbi:MAG: hypothetical protein JWP89_2610 [Schlesneria sp.]|nr:hypothetical protein [Schlesneria sp.]
MNFQSEEWKDEALGKTFIPESPEAALVAETVKRLGELLDIKGKETTVERIVAVAMFDAQEIYFNRVNS